MHMVYSSASWLVFRWGFHASLTLKISMYTKVISQYVITCKSRVPGQSQFLLSDKIYIRFYCNCYMAHNCVGRVARKQI